ncbi:sulfur oxidation c-type cytochrome SoxX [Thiomicrospira pelophila]|uniref:sulfur oxidation c-type cytochrome SoxX n=1 Tax=Thiomicrospira pelophila TaxID=934 RepID=UPI000690BB7F|nr:sulfur oxidation c-type cytochrome SoxX [Thiomicrospira pelophila]
MKKTILSTLVMGLFATSAFAMGDKPQSDAAFSDKQVNHAQALIDNSWTQADPKDRKRFVQDKTQYLCSIYKDQPPADIAKHIVEMNKAVTSYPEGGITLGDWKAGEKLANSGYGLRIGNIKADNPKKKPNGGNCYACHAMAPSQAAAGNLGPSLANYGIRGTSDAMLKYTYQKIFNAQATKACSNMPRFGYHGVLDDKQIADIMAYMLDPNSPVNAK